MTWDARGVRFVEEKKREKEEGERECGERT